MSEEQNIQDSVEPVETDATETIVDEQTEQVDALATAQQEIADLKDQMLRLQAEMQNVRRRAEADVEKAHKFGVEKFANEMLTVVDNLERALAATKPEDDVTKALHDGVELTRVGLVASLEKFNVVVVDPVNQPFNPELHQAITMIEAPDAAPNHVVSVMQKGYTISGRLLRPAMVVVNKGSASINEQA